VPRIQAELQPLGYKIAESTVAKYRVRSRKPPSGSAAIYLWGYQRSADDDWPFTRESPHPPM